MNRYFIYTRFVKKSIYPIKWFYITNSKRGVLKAFLKEKDNSDSKEKNISYIGKIITNLLPNIYKMQEVSETDFFIEIL